MGKCLIIAFLLLAQSAVAQVYCVRAIGHTPEHERIFFPKGDPMAAARVVADLGPAPVYPETAVLGKLFVNTSGERTNHFYQSCLPEVPVLDTRLQCPGNLLSQSDIFALLSGTFAVPRSVWTNHAGHEGGRYVFSLIGSGDKRYVIDLRGGSTAIVFFPDGTYRCIAPGCSCISNPSNPIMDLTTNQSSTCELHGIAMTNKIVEVGYGVDRSGRAREMRQARCALFPHAAERYNSGFCMAPSEKKRARIFVCSKCNEARNAWLQTHPRRKELND